ncbi:hypothetical protein M438DRAFT_362215 [Aureobasidium pullulans EXF-150]|uniref:Cryptic loci regulator 2 N-terminal domain-containing protein n=1 Tax=Aureobasidium pullulans EXF-150 TaxID=1043002 RepID=A0A074XZ97_AURPU|nr:uncharacterized protein M438DRAFT_362215 [Aureobasidium pullulans EXF-150]KEQ88964.1 hypothetical protein M438DRAFT_362215 [Aureobasidium pullulans EXF-150]
MSCTIIDFANYVSDGDSRLWPTLGPNQGQRQAQPLAPLLVVLRDYILAHHALEFVPFNGSLRVLNLPPGYIATVYTNAKGRPVHTCHGHPRGGQWTSFVSFIPHIIAILRGDVARCGCVLCGRYRGQGTPARKLPRPFWQIR